MYFKLYEVFINIIFIFVVGGLCIVEVVVEGLFFFFFKVLLGGGLKFGFFILLSLVLIFVFVLVFVVVFWVYGVGLVRFDWVGFIRIGVFFFCSLVNIILFVIFFWWMYRLKITILGNCIIGI